MNPVGEVMKEWLVAAKSFALMITAKDKHRIPHAMRFLLTTEGETFERSLSAFRETAAGNDLLKRRPDLRALCCNRASLTACPPDSLGYWYAEFMSMYGLDTEDYLGIAIKQGALFADDEERRWFHTRVDASHDIRHVLSGYGPDVYGEICLCWFRFAQIGHAGIFVLAVFGSMKLVVASRGAAFRALLEAYRRGRHAGLLDLLPWEDGLAQPLSVHRATLGLTPIKHYPTSLAPESYVRVDPTLASSSVMNLNFSEQPVEG